MTNKKHTDNKPHEVDIIKLPEGPTLQERLHAAFYQEAQRTENLHAYRRIATDYLKLAEEAKASVRESAAVIHRLITTRPFPEIVLRSEELIAQSRKALHQVVDMLQTNIYRNSDGLAEFNRENITTASHSADIAFQSFERILRSTSHLRSMSSESKRELPEVTDREKRIAKDSGIPPKIRKKEIPLLAEKLLRDLRIFAAGNAFSTVGDIDVLMESLRAAKPFFNRELEDWRNFDRESIQPLRDAGMPDEDIKAELERYCLDERVNKFREKFAQYLLALQIAEMRMEFVNDPDNKLLSAVYNRRLLKQLLESDDTDSYTDKKPKGIKGLLRKIRHGKKDAAIKRKYSAAYKVFLRKALLERKK